MKFIIIALCLTALLQGAEIHSMRKYIDDHDEWLGQIVEVLTDLIKIANDAADTQKK